MIRVKYSPMGILTPHTYAYLVLEKALGRSITSKLHALRQHARLTPQGRARLQKARLIEILLHSEKHVPYYQKLFHRLGFSANDIENDFNLFEQIPLLTKEIIQASPEDFLDSRVDRAGLHERRTGGSTGLTLSVYYSQESLDWTAAVNLFALEMTGRRHSDRELHLSSRMEMGHWRWQDRWRERIKCFAMHRSNVYTEDFSEAGLASLLNDIRREKPYLVQGHPSSLYQLALYCQASGTACKGLFRAFESTGESIDTEKTQVIESVFGCKVYNRFGNAEFGVVAHSQDDAQELQVFDSVTYAENFIYGSGIPEIVMTGLLNPAMPLIRYRTGDIGEVSGPLGDQRLHGVNGRIHDIIEVGDRKIPTHFIKDSIERIGGVNEFQVIQHRSGDRTINVVFNNPSKKPEIESRLKSILGERTQVMAVPMSALKRVGWRDKFRYLIKE